MAKKPKYKKRMSRKELKKPDRVLSSMERAVEYMGEQRKPILIGVIAIVVLAALWGVYRWRTQSQAEKAAQLYKKGQRIYTAMIDPSISAAQSGKSGEQGQAFKTRAARARAALKVFNKVVNEFEGYPIARVAHLYRGNCYFDLKKYGDAISAFKKVLSTSAGGCGGCGGGDESSDSLRALALENLGYAQAAKGRYDDARKTFGKLRSLQKGSRRDWAYWHEGLLREAKGDLPGAIKAYEMVTQTPSAGKGKSPDQAYALSPLNPFSTKRARYLKMKLEDLKRGNTTPKKPGKRPGAATPPPAMAPVMAPAMAPVMAPAMVPAKAPAKAPVMKPAMVPAKAPVMKPAMVPAKAPVMKPAMAGPK